MKGYRVSRQSGIGLIEVLIALIIVAIGLLGFASFTGVMLNLSGDSKARAEAMALAQQKIEQLRLSVDRDDATNGYTVATSVLASGNYSDTPAATTNASFTRNWNITDEASFFGPARKEVSVRVSWLGADGETKNVYAVTELAWIDPNKSFIYTTQDSAGTIPAPGPRQNASEDVASENVFNVPDSTISSGTAGTDNQITLNTVTSADGTLNESSVQLTQISPGSHYYATDNTSYFFVDEGVIAVFICEASCRYIQNHFGGVVLSTSGKVYSPKANSNDLTGITVAWTSSDVNACYQSTPVLLDPDGIANSGDEYYEMPYECVYAGNCDATATRLGIGTDSDGDGIADRNGCSSNVTNTHIADRGVGPGGEFGDIGLFGLDGTNGGDQMCFLEDTPYPGTKDVPDIENKLAGRKGTPNTQYNPAYLPAVTKRFYVSRRLKSNGNEISEGINRSYSNHNFLLVNRTQSTSVFLNCYQTVVTNYPGKFNLAQREVIRLMGTATNQVADQLAFTGLMPAITISGTAATPTPAMYVGESGSCYVKNDSTEYACVVPADFEDTSLTVLGGSVSKPTPTAADPAVSVDYASCTDTVNFDLANPDYNLDGSCNWPADF